MLDYLKRFFAFILPILRTAAIEVAADTLHQYAYPTRRPMPYTRYAHRPPRGRIEAVRNVGRAVREAQAFDVETTGTHVGKEFHDVLLIAFDISGPSPEACENFIKNYLPDAGDHTYKSEKFYLDSWWAANDQRFDGSDTMSAVFVSKGSQKQARELLKIHGLM